MKQTHESQPNGADTWHGLGELTTRVLFVRPVKPPCKKTRSCRRSSAGRLGQKLCKWAEIDSRNYTPRRTVHATARKRRTNTPVTYCEEIRMITNPTVRSSEQSATECKSVTVFSQAVYMYRSVGHVRARHFAYQLSCSSIIKLNTFFRQLRNFRRPRNTPH